MISEKILSTDGENTIFSCDFPIYSESHIKVYLDNVEVTLDKYDIINDAISFHVAPADGQILKMRVSTTPDDFVDEEYISNINIKTVDNIEVLREATVNYKYVRTLGYYIGNDGGSSLYMWNETSELEDNGGSIIKQNDNEIGRYELVLEKDINVKQFGLFGNSDEDITPILQTILDLYDYVYIPEGLYWVNGSLILEYKTFKKIYGDGELSILKLLPTSTKSSHGLKIKGCSNITVKNIQVDGNIDELSGLDPFEGPFGSGIIVQSSTYVDVIGIKSIDWAKHCIDISADAYDHGESFEVFRENQRYLDDGTRSSNVRIIDCRVSGAGDDNITTHQSDFILIDGCVSGDVKGGFVPTNSNAYEIDDGSRNVILKNSYAYNSCCGVQVKGHNTAAAPSNIVVENITIDNCIYGVDCYNTSYYNSEANPYISTTANNLSLKNITIKNLVDKHDGLGDEGPFFMRIRSYNNVKIENITMKDTPTYINFYTYNGIEYGGLNVFGNVRNAEINNVHFENNYIERCVVVSSSCNNVAVNGVYGKNSILDGSKILSVKNNANNHVTNIFCDDTFEANNYNRLVSGLKILNREEDFTSTIEKIFSVKGANSDFQFLRTYSGYDTSTDVEHSLKGDGSSYSDGNWVDGGDYAEYFEWEDGNINNEDRRGLAVSLVGKKIKVAESINDNIIGVISGKPGIIGNAGWSKWTGKYKKDIYGAYILDDKGFKILSPDYEEYEEDEEYIPREKRKEWSPVGLVGQLVIRKESIIPETWILMEEIDENHSLYLVK